jgi:hypothetical protein
VKHIQLKVKALAHKKKDCVMNKMLIIALTFAPLAISLSAGPPPPPPPPSGYQTMHVSQKQTMLIPPQLEHPNDRSEPVPHPNPSATPGAMTALLQNKQVPSDAKAIATIGPGSGLALSGKTYKIRPGENHKVPQAAHAISNGSFVSFTQTRRHAATTGQLFDNPELAQAYKNFIEAVNETPTFLPLFRKLHIVALHQIYLHLVGIYVTLNMTSVTDIKSYMALEKRFGLNKKTLIINQLVKIIQSQLTQALLTLMPGMPVSRCIKSGMASLDRDTLSNPDSLILDLEKSVLISIGAAPVTNHDAIDLYSALTSEKSKDLIKRNRSINISALKEGLKLIYQGAGFVQPLTKKPAAAEAVIAAIDTILGEQVLSKSNNNYQDIIHAIKTGSTQEITEQQKQIFMKTIKQFAYGAPLQKEIVIAKKLAKMIEEDDHEPLSKEAITALAGVVGFILQNYEQKTSMMLTAIVKKLGELNPELQTLSPMQKLELQNLSQRLDPSEGQTPLAFDAIPEEERYTLGIGFIILGSSSTNVFSRMEKQILIGVGQEIEKAPVAFSDLNSSQVTAIKKALLVFRSYQFTPVNQESMLTQFSEEEREKLTVLCSDVHSSKFKDFNQFSKEQQILLLRMYQGLVSVIQTRLHEHQEASRTLQTIFANNSQLKEQLFNSISASQYVTLNELDKLMKENDRNFSLSMVSSITPPTQPTDAKDNPPISQKDALAKMFLSSNKTTRTSYLSILYQLQKQNNTNPALQNVIDRIPKQEQEQYQNIIEATTHTNFTFSDLNDFQRRMLVRDFKDMQQASLNQPIEHQAQKALLAGTPAARIQTMATLIKYTMNFKNTKTSFLWILKHYLLFFRLYCSTLQDYQSNGYVGLTKFEDYAKEITQKLRGTEIEKLNPPLFFYNKETLDGIRMLPQLAQLVEKTEIVPYPTFPMLLAIEGSTIDPLDGKTYSNQSTLTVKPFNKFFFIDTSQKNSPPIGADPQTFSPPSELAGQDAQSIKWIKKIDIPASTKETSYLVENEQGKQENIKVKSYNFAFFPDNIPPGISGFYMNIPIFAPSPLDSRKSLIRLYEQPIYAQPPWLNFPGFSNREPDNMPGVITMLRGCLGDFAALLDLNVFDPCLSVIFSSALALPDKGASFKEQEESNQYVQNAMVKCSRYLQAKQAEIQRMSQPYAVNPSAISPRAEAGGTGQMPVHMRPQTSGVPSLSGTNSAEGGVAL